MSKRAHIVAINTNSLGDLGFGICGHPDSAQTVFDMGEVWIGPRPELEVNTDFVQPIPYLRVLKGEEVLSYTRAATGADNRLHAKVSVGFGGHVDLADAVTDEDGVIDLKRTLLKAARRELEEELGISLAGMMPEQIEQLFRWSHIISCRETPVDEVHIGFVATIDVTQLPGIDPAKFEDAIGNAKFMLPADLLRGEAEGDFELETWSRLVCVRSNIPAA